MTEDSLLIYKFKRDSKEALRRIYEKYRNYLLKIAVVLEDDTNTAEDAVEDVFVSFAQSADRIRLAGSLKHYLATSLANRIRNLRRDRQRHRESNIDDAKTVTSNSVRPEQWVILNEQLQLLTEAMAEIPYEQREVIALYMQGDLTFRQIAKQQNASINTIQGRYRYGIEKLRNILKSRSNQ